MKIVSRNIENFQEKYFFSPIRSKVDFIKVILYSCRILLLNGEFNNLKPTIFRLVIDKMKRLFFSKDERYYSIMFPFNLTVEDNEIIEIATHSDKKIDFRSISILLGILEDMRNLNAYSITNYFLTHDDISEDDLLLFEELVQFEPCYIRYDYDTKNANGYLHPISHLDINYSQNGTFKLGLSDKIPLSFFEDIQNTNTDCAFLSKAKN